jgi:hypothetical protein
MSTNNSTSNQDKAVQNEFNTFMALREKGIDPDRAFRAADHVRRATNEGGDAGATSAAVRVMRWLGLLAAVAIVFTLYTYLPMVSNPRSSWIVAAPTATPQPEIGDPPVVPVGGAK